MPAAPIPSKPWTDLGCDPLALIEVVSATVRGDATSPARFFREDGQAAHVVEVLTARHRVGPFLYAALEEAGTLSTLPQPAYERLLKSAEAQAAATSLCLSHVSELHGLLGAKGYPFLLLKGPELGIRFGRGAAARGYRDVDVLVAEKNRQRACKVLEEAGYHRLSRWFLGSSLSSRFNHAVDYRKGDRLLDLHWCVSRAPGIGLKTDDLFDRSVPFEINGMTFRALRPEDELTVLLISAFADIQRGYLRLQSFVDIAQVVSRLPSGRWDVFFQEQKTHGTDALGRAVLGLVARLFRCEEAWSELFEHLYALPTREEALAVLLPSPGGRAAKRWALPYLPVSSMRYLCGWCVSLPFRVASSHPMLRRRHSV
jgi:hypothetical protein